MDNGGLIDLLTVGGMALAITACFAAAALGPETAERIRIRCGIAAVIAITLAIGAGVWATNLATAPESQVRDQVALELDQLGFEAPAGYALNSPELYRFDDDSLNSGVVSVAGIGVARAWFAFKVIAVETYIGCPTKEGISRAGPATRRILLRLGGCANLK